MTAGGIMRAIHAQDLVTLQQAAELAGTTLNAVKQACRHLERARWIEKVEPGVYRPTACGRYAGEEGMELPKGKYPRRDRRRPERETVRDVTWRYFRFLGRATVSELAHLAAQAIPGKDHSWNVRAYLKALERCGYAARLPRDQRVGQAWADVDRFSLIRNTGGATPIWRPSRKTLFDPNIRQEVRPLPAAAVRA